MYLLRPALLSLAAPSLMVSAFSIPSSLSSSSSLLSIRSRCRPGHGQTSTVSGRPGARRCDRRLRRLERRDFSPATPRFASGSPSESEGERSSPSPSKAEFAAILEPPLRGVFRDYSRRLPLYKSDVIDGFNSQSLAAVLFLFFACLAPAVGFGGILGAATGGAMGTMEMTLSTAGCGVLYALLSAQPMQLIGPMGPIVAYTVSLISLAEIWGVEFLPLYAWTGIWTSGYMFLAACTSASNVVKYVTSFTDEIFSVLISVIFLWEAVRNVGKAFAVTSGAATASAALMNLLCAGITFLSSLALRGCNRSVYFTKSIRTNASNFAPAIGVVLGSTFARFARLRFPADVGASLPALSIPATFSTTTGRPWLVPLDGLPVWARWGAALPAILAAVLLFLDQNITARLVNHPRYKMRKGREEGNVIDGMHGDLLTMSAITFLASLVGLPWMGGATTRSAAHVRSLTRIDPADGTTIVGSIENRVTGASIHALIGACVLFAGPRALLAQVPLPVLSGVFLYLGLTSLQGLELYDRFKGFFQDSSLVPSRRWSSVRRRTTNLFTSVQIACVAGLMGVTKSSYGVVAPLLIALLPLVRWGLGATGIVSVKDLDVLDEPPSFV